MNVFDTIFVLSPLILVVSVTLIELWSRSKHRQKKLEED